MDDDISFYGKLFVAENVVVVSSTLRIENKIRKFPTISAFVLNSLCFAMPNEDYLMQRKLKGLGRKYKLA